MTNDSYVVVFPSVFTKKKMPLLMKNIKKILEIKDQPYTFIKKDDSLIIVEANDPVFASSAINLLFGIKMVAIAKQIPNKFETIVSEVTKVGSSLLLKGDRFYVKVEGNTKGFFPKDLEMATTSSIIEKSVKIGAHPGTEYNHNKLLYTFLTKSNAYVCVFSDNGLGGIPCGTHKQIMLCGIFDELSAVSCIETIKQGFEIRLIVGYRKDSDLTKLAKMINQIIPRMVTRKINIEFFKINLSKNDAKNYAIYFQAVLQIIEKVAKKMRIDHVSLPVSPLIFPAKLIDNLVLKFAEQKIIAYTPLGALEDEIYDNAREIGLGKFISNIENLVKIDFSNKYDQKKLESITKTALQTSKNITIRIGPNNVHEILDELQNENKI